MLQSSRFSQLYLPCSLPPLCLVEAIYNPLHSFLSSPNPDLLSRVSSSTGAPRFIGCHFIVLHRCSNFYKLKARTSSNKKIIIPFIGMVWNRIHNICEICLYYLLQEAFSYLPNPHFSLCLCATDTCSLVLVLEQFVFALPPQQKCRHRECCSITVYCGSC